MAATCATALTLNGVFAAAIIFAILALGTGETAGFVALTIAVLPFVANIVRSNVQARDKTLVTSGVYERMIEVDGKQYHHILDTDTGWPVDSDLDAVTLIADKGSSADIDAAATICLIKGLDGARSYLEEYMDGVEAVFVLKDGSIVATEGSGFEES